MARIRLRYPGGRCKALTLSYDDGVQTDVRLIEIMKKNGLKGTFNLNSGPVKDPQSTPGHIAWKAMPLAQAV